MVEPIERLILQLARLPGIGERSAARLAHHIIKVSCMPNDFKHSTLAVDLSQALKDVQDQVGLCQVCQNLCVGHTCNICLDHRRDVSMVCVVEGIPDLRAIEHSGAYKGLYHVLHGALAPLDGIGPQELHLDKLILRVRQNDIKEVIAATNANMEGDATALYLAQLLSPIGVQVSRPASGIPLGGEMEFLDQGTLSRAFAQRRLLT